VLIISFVYITDLMPALAEHGTLMPTYQEAVAQYNDWLAGRASAPEASPRAGTPTPSLSTTTSATSTSMAVPVSSVVSTSTIAPAAAAPAMVQAIPVPSTPTRQRRAPALFLSDKDEDELQVILPATPTAAPPTPQATATAPTPTAAPTAADPTLLPPYSEVSMPRKAANYAAAHLQHMGRPRSRSRVAHDDDAHLIERARTTATPHTPAKSLPLTTGSFVDDGYDFNTFDPLRLPTPTDQRKAYAAGRGEDIFDSIPGNTGILASSSDPDFFNSPNGIRVEQDQQRLGVRLSSDNAIHLSGEVLTMGDTGSTASAAGPSARVLSINTAQGVATSAYFKHGRAHITVARAPLASSPPPSSPSIPAAAQQAKRRWESTSTAPVAPAPPTTTARRTTPLKARTPAASKSTGHARPHGAARPTAIVAAAPASAPTRASAPVPARARAPASIKSASTAPSPAPSKRLKLASGTAVPASAVAPAVAPAHATSSGGRSSNTGRLVKRVAPETVLPADELKPLTTAMFAALNITPAGLAGTALSNIGVHVLENLAQFGVPCTRLIANLIALDHHKDVPRPSATDNTIFTDYAGDRPAHLVLFYNNTRRFNTTLFVDFDGMYLLQFWTWWDVLTADIRFGPTTDYQKPGGLKPGADLKPFMLKGPHGFGAVVAGVLVLIFGHMVDQDKLPGSLTFNTTPTKLVIRQWFCALQCLDEVATAMVSSLA
jgi:hypothetical protein